MSIGWAILGTGGFPEDKVAPAMKLAEGSELVAVLSRDLARANEFAGKHGALIGYDSIETVLNDLRVDAVYIATANDLHASYATMAARAGKHVLMEKPLALDMSEGIEVVRAAKVNGVRLGLGFELRQHPGRIEARDFISNGALGTVSLVQSQFGGGLRGAVQPEPRSGFSQWWTEPEKAGGFGYHRVVASVQLIQIPVRLPDTFGNRVKPRFAGQDEGAGYFLSFGVVFMTSTMCHVGSTLLPSRE